MQFAMSYFPSALRHVVAAMSLGWVVMGAAWSEVGAAEEAAPQVYPALQHLSTARGDLPAPNGGNQQTASLVLDIDGDGLNDFVIAERTQAPAVVWYKRTATGWTRHVLEGGPLRVEAGGAYYDISGDGAPDVVFGGDAGSKEVWWWENPHPRHDPNTPWRRRIIKASGASKHHDQLFGDFDGDGRVELVFWNQGARQLVLARIPPHPREQAGEWPMEVIYAYPEEEMQPRGSYPGWRRPNEHEGLAAADMDGDGVQDLVGAGRWFKHEKGGFVPHLIDAAYSFTRAAVGRFKPGARPQVVMCIGDGKGPMLLYEYQKGTWVPKTLMEELTDAHSLQVVDFNGDQHLDIFVAEMQLGKNPRPRAWILLGNGQGAFKAVELLRGFDLHEARMADLNGDGRLDILAKPYTWQAPRLDVFLSRGQLAERW
ncbi:MAG: VCBS repeat-containing protein [Verrucomicrobiae bacterium]|nr:VCBS repeat-containing protein [Verrucomicrobiae bacterium]